jgi:hypothetical protein
MIQARVDAVVGRRLERSELVGIGAEVRRAEKGRTTPVRHSSAVPEAAGGRVSMRHVQAQLEAMAEVRPRLE